MTQSDRHTLGPQLRALRHDAGLSRRAVAEACGCSYAVVWNWENGYSLPPPRCSPRLCTLYGVDALPLTEKFTGMDLAAVRRRAGWQQGDAARALGVTSGVMHAWERGHRHLPPETTKALAALYGVAPETIALPPPRLKGFGPVLDGGQVRAARTARGWTQNDLATRLGVTSNTVARWETQPRSPRWAQWETLTEMLNMTIAELSCTPTPQDDPDADGPPRRLRTQSGSRP